MINTLYQVTQPQHDRSPLGPADVDDARLAGFVATLLDRPSVELLSSRVEPVEYALTTLTTGARHVVRGEALVDGRPQAWALFVKVPQTALRSPVMDVIPPEFQALTAGLLPWQIEPNAYRSRLASLMPPGLRLPRCVGVVDLDDESTAMWLEVVDHDPRPWGPDRYRSAAERLGRFAGDERIAHLDPGLMHPSGPTQARSYFEGRLRHQHLPAYADETFWAHPLIRSHVDETLRARVHALVDAAPALIEEIEALPLVNGHGDACPQNLLVEPDGLVAIDWGFWSRVAVGFDLSQLVVSEIELGRKPAGDLRAVQAAALEGYRAGLAGTGTDLTAAELSRAHAVQLAMASGLTALPLEQLGEPDSPGLEALTVNRVVALRLILEGVDL